MQVAEENSDLLFQAAFENASIGMALIDLEGNWIKVNKSVCKITGYSKDELIGRTFQDITHPKDLKRDLMHFNALLEGKASSYEIEKRYYHKDGQIIWIILNATLVRDADGNPRFFISQIQDITERKRYESRLVREKERVETIIDGTKAGIWEWNIGRDKIKVNDYFIKMIGYPKERVNYLSFDEWEEYVHPEDWEELKEEVMRYAKGYGTEYETEFRMKSFAGDWIHVLSRAKITKRKANGEGVRLFGIVLDLSTTKRAQMALMRSERRFRGIFDSTFQFIGLLDTKGILKEANQTALDFGGLKRKDVIGKPFWEAHWWQISQETKEQLTNAVAKARAGEIVQYEVEVWDKHKEPVTILFSLKPIVDTKGSTEAIIAEGVLIQDLVNARKRLIDQNLALKNFTHIAAHDLKQPSRTIGSLLELVVKKNEGKLDEKSAQLLDAAMKGSRKMSTLIDDLLEYSQSGVSEKSSRRLSMKALLENVLASLNSQIEDSDASIQLLNLPDEKFDEFAFTLLFQNLINNAIKYRRKNVHPIVKISYEQDKQSHIFKIADNGIGIAKEHHEKIFQMFKKLHPSSVYAGNGIGLATCKKIVNELKGTIEVESVENQGSTFLIKVPTEK